MPVESRLGILWDRVDTRHPNDPMRYRDTRAGGTVEIYVEDGDGPESAAVLIHVPRFTAGDRLAIAYDGKVAKVVPGWPTDAAMILPPDRWRLTHREGESRSYAIGRAVPVELMFADDGSLWLRGPVPREGEHISITDTLGHRLTILAPSGGANAVSIAVSYRWVTLDATRPATDEGEAKADV